MKRLRAALAALGMAVCSAAPAAAVLIASGDGTGNTSAPPDDPGFDHVGVVNNLTAIYLGDGWVLTANHVGTGSINLGGVVHPVVAGSTVRLVYSGSIPTDLRLFRLVTDPGLESLSVAASAPAPGTPAVMIGRGRSRGAAVTWNEVAGWAWAYPNIMRWGTNHVTQNNLVVGIGDSTTRSLSLEFDDDGGISDEAIAATGDSGGALFVPAGDGYELAGVLYAIYGLPGQPTNTSLFGGGTLAADLAYYSGQIAAVTAQLGCDNGVDDDADGLLDVADPGCLDTADAFETNALVPCDDGFDSDADGLVDWPDDPGCRDLQWLYENPKCDDDVDNDGDGTIDWDGGPAAGTPDPECTTAWRNAETPPVHCGLGFELALIVPLVGRLRRLRA